MHGVLREALVVQYAVCDVEHELSVCKVKRFEFALFVIAIDMGRISAQPSCVTCVFQRMFCMDPAAINSA